MLKEKAIASESKKETIDGRYQCPKNEMGGF
jgi:hypothetical protein